MTRAELIAKLKEKYADYNPAMIDICVREIFSAMVDSLAEGKRIEIRGFGSFEVRVRAPREAHNPKTGEKVALDQRRVVHFKPGVKLKSRVNHSNVSTLSN